MLQEPFGEAIWYQCPTCFVFFPSIRDRVKLIREQIKKELEVGAGFPQFSAEKISENAPRRDATENISESAANFSDASASKKELPASEVLEDATESKNDSTEVGEKRLVVDSVEFPNDRMTVYSRHCS